MKNYTVKEISTMLSTSEETVRRWIRAKKLDSIKPSKKIGNIVSEDKLNDFLETYPKYQNIAVSSAIAGLVAGGIAISATLLRDYISKRKEIKNDKYASAEMRRIIEKQCADIRMDISVKEKEKKVIENDIAELENQLRQYEDCLNSLIK